MALLRWKGNAAFVAGLSAIILILMAPQVGAADKEQAPIPIPEHKPPAPPQVAAQQPPVQFYVTCAPPSAAVQPNQNEESDAAKNTDRKSTDNKALMPPPEGVSVTCNYETTYKQADRNENKNAGEVKWTDIVGAFTAVAYLFVAIGLLIFAGLTWKVSVRQANIMARQAKIMAIQAGIGEKQATLTETQATTLRAIEAANIALVRIDLLPIVDSPPGLSQQPIPGGPVPGFTRIALTAHNQGRTRGTVVRICLEWRVISGELPDSPVYEHFITRGYIFQPNQPLQLIWGEGVIELDEAREKAVRTGTERLWVYGFYTYEDVFGDRYDVGFVAHWEAVIAGLTLAVPRGFILEGPPNYYYVRKHSSTQNHPS